MLGHGMLGRGLLGRGKGIRRGQSDWFAAGAGIGGTFAAWLFLWPVAIADSPAPLPAPSSTHGCSLSEGCPVKDAFADSDFADSDSTDYFEAIVPSRQGYLFWPEQPVWVYVEPPAAPASGSVSPMQLRWYSAVEGAIADWSPHMALARTEQREQANIRIFRAAPPLKWIPEGPRARNAETQFRLFWETDAAGKRCFRHQQTIFLSDRQGSDLLRGTARHELGHALGLWGHSPDPGDALYSTQVGLPPQISPRDINTLRRVYQQPPGLRCLDSTSGATHGSRE